MIVYFYDNRRSQVCRGAPFKGFNVKYLLQTKSFRGGRITRVLESCVSVRSLCVSKTREDTIIVM